VYIRRRRARAGLGVLDAGVAGDVIAEGVAHRVRREVRVDAGAAAELHDDGAQYLAGGGL
jgi:hypothetical protein